MENATFWKEFFQIYKELPALWRVKSNVYTDRVLKAKCYTILIEKLKEIYPDANREMVVKKINNFRTSYRKEFKRVRDGKNYKTTLWYFDYLRFLDDQDEGWTTERLTSEMENNEQQMQGSRDALTNSEMDGKDNAASTRMRSFKDSEEECLPHHPSSERRKLIHRVQKKSSRKPSYAEQEAKIDADILAKSWAVQYKGMKENQKLIARKLISDILFYGSLGTLNTSNAIALQDIFIKEPTNLLQHSNLKTQTLNESNSSFRFAQQNILHYSSMQESPIEYNSSSPVMSPTTNRVADVLDVKDIKFEMP